MVREDAGTPISLLAPAVSKKGCPHTSKCLIGDSDCLTSGVIYHCVCVECPKDNPETNPPSLYIGTSGSNIHHRSLLHKRDIKKTSSSLYKHNSQFHNESITDTNRFKFEKISSHSSVMQRLITEAYKISHSNEKLMNSKNEYGQGKWISLETVTETT